MQEISQAELNAITTVFRKCLIRANELPSAKTETQLKQITAIRDEWQALRNGVQPEKKLPPKAKKDPPKSQKRRGRPPKAKADAKEDNGDMPLIDS